ncbi:DUF6325 family protein [Actinotalea sp.]|uniref:DUF6325 family protein n=1 Tax=Actinotalea sp. TaxID=1872145 RepID=UPI002BE1B82D|nr:DUF6325 family protein [Actinotalea sp.]HOT57225.1 DUF6325 family protein [Ornithinibacter sp.]HRA51669.1 DUF6325 family protein [Actinotalea sp.]
MTTTDTERAHGPIDFLLLEFPSADRQSEAADAMFELVDNGTVRLLDLVVVRKFADGGVEVLDLDTLAGEVSFTRFSGARSGLLGPEDIAQASEAIEHGSLAALIVFENSWAAPFVAAVRRGGGDVIASMRIPAADVMDALDALESTESE